MLLGIVGALGVGVGTTALAWSITFGLALVPALYLFWGGRPNNDTRPHETADGGYWSFAAPQALATVFQVILRWADIILVTAIAGAAAAAVYTAATRLLLAGNFLNLAIVQAISPMISNALARGDRDEATDLLRTGTAWLVAAVWPGYLLLMIFGGQVLDLFGNGYASGGTALAVLAAAMLVASAVGPIESVLLMSGGSRLSLADNAAAVAINTGLNLALIPAIGIEGAAIAWAAGLLVTNLAPLLQVHRRLGINPFGPGLLRAGVSSMTVIAIPALAINLVFDPGLVVVVVASGLLCGLYVLALGYFRDDLHLSDLTSAFQSRTSREERSDDRIEGGAKRPGERSDDRIEGGAKRPGERSEPRAKDRSEVS